MGSFTLAGNSGGIPTYMGLSIDVPNLPTDFKTGATAYCIDTGEVYIFESSTQQWYLQ